MATTENREPEEVRASAQEAYEHRNWVEASDAFASIAPGSRLTAEELRRWGTASYMLGRVDQAVDILSRAYQAQLGDDQPGNAAKVGFWVAFMLMERGEPAQAGGWLAKSAQLLEEVGPEDVSHGYMLALQVYKQVAVDAEYIAGRAAADEVIRWGRRGRDPDLEALGLNLKGRALIRAGEIQDGLSVLDEAMVMVVSSPLSPIVVGTVYCSLIEACEEVADLERAREWTGALTRWCDRQSGEVPFTAECRVHRSKILQGTGELKAAEEEAQRAYEDFTRTPYEPSTGRALYQLAEVQRISGELDRAEESYRQASDWGIDPQPGLALLRLMTGDAETAAASLRRLLEEPAEPIDRLRLLPAHVEVMLAVGDHLAAGSAAEELADLASVFATTALIAQASYAAGAVSLAGGEAGEALSHLRRAVAGWLSLGNPYEVARTRTLIGRACKRLGDDEAAALELSAASRLFNDLGVADLTERRAETRDDHGLSSREMEVLQLLATGATNRSIAEDLYVAVKTVDRHVSNILTKLGVSSRTAAVSYAHEHELV